MEANTRFLRAPTGIQLDRVKKPASGNPFKKGMLTYDSIRPLGQKSRQIEYKQVREVSTRAHKKPVRPGKKEHATRNPVKKDMFTYASIRASGQKFR
jgi:hypothetical protein